MKRLNVLTLLLIMLSVMSVALAQNVIISPQAIIINPAPAFSVEVFVDRDPSGSLTPTYEIGEQIRIGVRVGEDAFVYLFNVRADNQIVQFFPNRIDSDNYVRAGRTLWVPPDGARYRLTIGGPEGLNRVIAVASKRQLSTHELASFEGGGVLAESRLSQDDFARTLAIIVEPLPQRDWVTDTALFVVGRQAPPVVFGTIAVRSSPSGANVFINDRFAGTTPLSHSTTAGRHEVRLELSGYETYRETVTLRPGETVRVSASLSPLRRTGTVSFTSRPANAEVYVDGRFIGTTPTGAITLDEGTYQALFVRRGFSDTLVQFTVRAGTTQAVEANLRALTGSLLIQANVGGARVFINGTEYGTIPSGSGRLTISDLPAGRHELTVIAPGFRTFVREFDITSGRTTEVRVRQERR
jgi:hypothetical protein